jgi:MFS family permease
MGCGALFTVGGTLQVVATGQLGLIYGGRALTGRWMLFAAVELHDSRLIGLSVGASSMIVPVYISECSPPATRGRMIGLFEIMLQCWLVIGFWVSYGVNKHIPATSDAQWRVPFGLQLVPGFMLTLFMTFQPESPRWLMKAGRMEEATETLMRIRQLPADHEYLVWEMDMVKQQLEHETQLTSSRNLWTTIKEAFMTENRSRLLIGMALMMLQNLSGINALN